MTCLLGTLVVNFKMFGCSDVCFKYSQLVPKQLTTSISLTVTHVQYITHAPQRTYNILQGEQSTINTAAGIPKAAKRDNTRESEQHTYSLSSPAANNSAAKSSTSFLDLPKYQFFLKYKIKKKTLKTVSP